MKITISFDVPDDKEFSDVVMQVEDALPDYAENIEFA